MKTCPSCGQKLDKMEVVLRICSVCSRELPQPTASELEAEWFEGGELMMDAVHDVPETVWPAILKILEHELTPDQIADLAAGPMEDLLAQHGARFIERVEAEAQRNPRLNHLLGGVWKSSMTEEIWERVQKARKEVW
ncbi:MAG TPA: hypothetical protein VMP11_05880 [Verrucomicrobiae bacterium]|nr:hypothetical protein [Verrucomicrobiae bacterium]